MPSLKTIRRRITSVKNTKQITRAMKLVSAAKLRRAQDSAVNGKEFAERLDTVLSQVITDLPSSYSHPLLRVSESVKKRRIIAISADRGLCGAFNSNISKAVLAFCEKNSDIQTDFAVLGRKTIAASKHWNGQVVSEYGGLPDDATSWEIDGIIQGMTKDFISGNCEEVFIVYTEFLSIVKQEVVFKQILPFIPKASFDKKISGLVAVEKGKVKYDPPPVVLFEQLLPLILRNRLIQAGLESKASEHAARMRAMDAATRNADELIDKLRLYYNRARQSAITTELIDIVGGAEAQG